jgi:hypothetical protein
MCEEDGELFEKGEFMDERARRILELFCSSPEVAFRASLVFQKS